MTCWQVAAATGHRKLTRAQRGWVEPELARVAVKLRDQHRCETAVSGMALLVDQAWAEAAVAARLKLHAVVPFPAQPDRWPEKDQTRWRRILQSADRVTVVSEDDPADGRAAARMLHRRNDKMLVISDVVVAVWDPKHAQGGTWSAVNKAVGRGLPVVWLNPASESVSMPTNGRWREILAAALREGW